MQETWVWSLGQKDPLEKGMATYSSILAWKIAWTEGPGGLQSMGLQRVGQDWVTNTDFFASGVSQPLAAAAAKSLQSCLTLCDPIDGSPQAPPSLGFSRQEHWSGLPFPSPMHESEKWKWSRSSCPTPSDPMDCSLPGSSIHGIFQAKVLEWGAIAFSSHPLTALVIPGTLMPAPCLAWCLIHSVGAISDEWMTP